MLDTIPNIIPIRSAKKQLEKFYRVATNIKGDDDLSWGTRSLGSNVKVNEIVIYNLMDSAGYVSIKCSPRSVLNAISTLANSRYDQHEMELDRVVVESADPLRYANLENTRLVGLMLDFNNTYFHRDDVMTLHVVVTETTDKDGSFTGFGQMMAALARDDFYDPMGDNQYLIYVHGPKGSVETEWYENYDQWINRTMEIINTQHRSFLTIQIENEKHIAVHLDQFRPDRTGLRFTIHSAI